MVVSFNAFAKDMNEIEHHLFCSIFSYQILKGQILNGNTKIAEELEQLDMSGVLLGKAQQLVLKKYGSGKEKHINQRNLALKLFNKEMTRMGSLPEKEQMKQGQEIGLECGKLYGAIFYTKKDLKAIQEDWDEMWKDRKNE